MTTIENNTWWSPTPERIYEMQAQWDAKFDSSAQSGRLERFRQWVVGLRYHPRPSVGFGGPTETPFANTIPGPPMESVELIAAKIIGSPSGNPEDLSIHALHRVISQMGEK